MVGATSALRVAALALCATGARGWRCSGCPKAPNSTGTVPACDYMCIHGACVANQCGVIELLIPI